MDASTDPSRDEVVEVMEVKPQSRPLEKARARYVARMGRRLTSEPGSGVTPPPLTPIGGHIWSRPGKDGIQGPTDM